ncbi:MAG TPA: beta-ketoacyl synthase N-terminal-like domain-containing protein, partial [Phycisphaerae bacterium]|nr:beta-ketoacyl synthase N-terminal-like domain-containing protein [Phycisphaerae bacterium]
MRDCPIAIVGLGGVFPGAFDVGTFWSNIANGRAFSRPAPAGRWVVDPARVPIGYGPDSVASVYGCFVDDAFALDADALGLSIDASIISRLDPVYSMAVHAGAQAFRDAKMAGVDRSRIGVILAAIALPTEGASAMTRETLGERFRREVFAQVGASESAPFYRTVDPMNARATALPGALVAEALGLGGGSFTLDAACASSLYAVKLACDALRLGECDAMIAGGVSRPDCLYTQMGFTQLKALSRSGVCAPFDASSDGLVVGEGAGAVVLKRLDDARRDGDVIYGVIRGIGLSNDIGGSLLAPDSEGQLRAMRAAYEMAGWRPGDVELVECHGTGTPLGDAVEVRSLRALWETDTQDDRRCAIGSIKSMIGHLLTGAGAAGLIKTLMAMRTGVIPPSANYRDSGDVIPLAGSAFYVPTEAAPWEPRAADGLRRAAVSAFGFGGINAHVLIEEAGEATAKASCVVTRPATLAPIAIVGMDARFGEAEGLGAFRDVVFAGASAFGERSATRWRGAESMLGDALNGLDIGAYLDRIDVATGEFKIPPNEIAEILPQQLVMLKSVAAAMRDASLNAKEARPRWGVIVGMALDPETTNFHLRWWLRQVAPHWAERLGLSLDSAAMAAWTDRLIASIQAPLNAPGVVGNLGGMIASRIAREFRFGGPSFGVSSEETSGLRALDVAMRSLQWGETDVCVVGAVDLAGDWRLALSRGDALTGAVIGEGAATVVLKRLSDAERDGDRVYAIVRGVGAATDGGELSGASSRDAISTAMRRALERVDAPASSIGYIERAACGNVARDGEEILAIRDVMADRDATSERVADAKGAGLTLGAAYGDVGACGAASGMVSLVRAALVIHERILPADAPAVGAGVNGGVIGSDDARDALHAMGANIPLAPMYWRQDRAAGPRRAGVTALSTDGNAAHVVLEERVGVAAEDDPAGGSPIGAPRPFVFACSGADTAEIVEKLTSLRAMSAKAESSGQSIETVWSEAIALHRATDARCVALTADSFAELTSRVDEAMEHLQSRRDTRLDGRGGIWYSPAPMGCSASGASGEVDDRAPAPEGMGHPLDGGLLVDRGAHASPDALKSDGRSIESGEPDHRDPTLERVGHPGLDARASGVAFVFPGSGNHFVGMGREIAAQWPHVVRSLDREYAHLASHSMVNWFAPYRHDWSEGWERDATARACEDMRRVIFAQVAYGVLTHDLLRDIGLRPSSVIGYSLGESTSLFATRAWPDADEMWRRMSASNLFRSDLYAERDALKRAWGLDDAQAASWRSVIFAKPAEEVRAALDGVSHARLMIVNAPKECVVGGLPDALAIVGERLKTRAVPVDGVPTVHFDAVREVEDAYLALHVMETRPDPLLRYYSCHLGRAYDVTQATAAESITAQALHGFDFSKLVEQAYADGVRVFIEAGPQASCTRMIRRILGDRPHFAMSIGAGPGERETAAVMRLAAACLAERLTVDLARLGGSSRRRNVDIEERQNAGNPSEGRGRRIVSVPVGGRPALPQGLDAFCRVGCAHQLALDSSGDQVSFDALETDGGSDDSGELDRRAPTPEGVGHPRDQVSFDALETDGGSDDSGELDRRAPTPEGVGHPRDQVSFDALETDGGSDDSGALDRRAPTPEGVGHPAESRGMGHPDGLMELDAMPEHAQAMMEAAASTAAAHEAFMRFAEAGREGLLSATRLQMELVEAAMRAGISPEAFDAPRDSVSFDALEIDGGSIDSGALDRRAPTPEGMGHPADGRVGHAHQLAQEAFDAPRDSVSFDALEID